MTMFFDGEKPVWQDHQHYPWNEYKHLDRDKFEELLQCMIDAYPDHELTEWLQPWILYERRRFYYIIQ